MTSITSIQQHSDQHKFARLKSDNQNYPLKRATWREVVDKDCQTRRLNKENVLDH